MNFEHSFHKVLVCIPVWNGQESISKTLESLLAQTYSDFDVLVVDNVSDDKTFQIAKTFARQHPERFFVQQNEKNLGRIGNWNRCLEWFEKTKHSYIKFVFAGDVLEKNALEILVNESETQPHVGLIAASYNVQEEKSLVAKVSFPKHRNFTPQESLEQFCKEGNWVGAPLSCLISKSAMKGSRFKEGFEWVADALFFIDIASSASSLYIPQKIGTFEVANRKFYQKYRDSDLARIENLYIKYYALGKLEKIDEKAALVLRQHSKKEDGKTILAMLSFPLLLELFGREIMRRIKRKIH